MYPALQALKSGYGPVVARLTFAQLACVVSNTPTREECYVHVVPNARCVVQTRIRIASWFHCLAVRARVPDFAFAPGRKKTFKTAE